LLLRGLRFANWARPKLPHGTSCCGIFATLGEYFSPITLLGDFPVRMSQLEHVGGRAHGCRDDSIDCDSGVRCRFCAGPLGRQARPLRRCEIEEGTVSDFTSSVCMSAGCLTIAALLSACLAMTAATAESGQVSLHTQPGCNRRRNDDMTGQAQLRRRCLMVAKPMNGINAPQRPDCVAGHVRLELRNVGANYPFERSQR